MVKKFNFTLLLLLAFTSIGLSEDDLKKDAERLSESIKTYGKYVRSRTKKSPKSQVPPLYLWLAKKGDIGIPTGNGTLDNHNRFHVQQVIDDRNLIIETRKAWISTEFREDLMSKEVEVWISNFPTEGVTDDSWILLSKIFEVKGTRRYETASGSNTVLEITPFSIQDGATLKKLVEAEKKK